MITLENIKVRLAEALKHCNMTQTELANKLNVTQSTIAHYIKGDIVPSLDTFANLCKVLDVDANYILCQKTKLNVTQLS